MIAASRVIQTYAERAEAAGDMGHRSHRMAAEERE